MTKFLFSLILFVNVQSFATTAEDCPASAQANLSEKKVLVFVTTDSWDSSKAKLNVYTMGSNGYWAKSKDSSLVNQDAYIGKNGIGWGHDYHSERSSNQAIKLEGDGKSPAGVFSIGESFGITPYSGSSNYTQIMRELKKGEEADPDVVRIVNGKKMVPNFAKCSDDTEQPKFYDRIWREDITKFVNPTSGELLGGNKNYTCGLHVKTNSKIDEKDKDGEPTGTGSCIFVHHFKEAKYAEKETRIKTQCTKLSDPGEKAACAKKIEDDPQYNDGNTLATTGCTAIHEANMCKLMEFVRSPKNEGKVAFSTLPTSELQKSKWRACFPGVDLPDVAGTDAAQLKAKTTSK